MALSISWVFRSLRERVLAFVFSRAGLVGGTVVELWNEYSGVSAGRESVAAGGSGVMLGEAGA